MNKAAIGNAAPLSPDSGEPPRVSRLGVDPRIDRLVAHVHGRIVRVFPFQLFSDLLWRPLAMLKHADDPI